MLGLGLGQTSLRRQGPPPVITATVAPGLGPLTEAQVPADGYSAGTYASSAGTIASAVATYLVNGSPEASSYDLSEGDTVQVSVLVTDSAANNRVFQTNTVTVTVAALDDPPELSGSGLSDQSYVTTDSADTFSITGAFTVGPGVFSISPATDGVVIDLDTGDVTVTPGTTGILSDTFTVYKTNSGGAVSTTFEIVVTLPVTADSVVDMVATGNDYLETNVTSFNGGVGDGLILFGWVYYDGVTWDDGAVIISVADNTVATRYLALRTGAATSREVADRNTTVLATPTIPGWYFCASRHSGSTNQYFRRNGVEGTTTGLADVNNVATLATKLAIGRMCDSTPSNYLNQAVCGVGVTNGTLTQMRNFADWVYNSGEGRDPSTYDFAGAGMTLVHYWPLAKIGGSGTVLATDDALDDTAGALDNLPVGGSPQWLDVAPPWGTGGYPVSALAGEVPVGATDTLELVATVPIGTWSASPTVNTAKITVWSEKGPGFVPSITGYSTSVAGDECTVTLTLDRTIYADEPIQFEMLNNWITDAKGNYSARASGQATNSSADAWPATWEGVSMGKCAVKFSTAVAGQVYDIEGECFQGARVAPCTITEEWPAREAVTYPNDDLKRLHGAMKNPVRVANSNTNPFNYKDAYHPQGSALPISLTTGDTYVKSRGNEYPTTTGGGTSLHGVGNLGFMWLECSSSTIGANEWPGQIIMAAGQSRAASLTLDPTTISLPAYSVTGLDALDWDTVSAHRKRFNPIQPLMKATEERRSQGPSGFTLADCYGENITSVINALYPAMVSDLVAESERRKALVWEIFHGYQTYWPIRQAKTSGGLDYVEPDGATSQGILSCCWIYLACAGLNTEIGQLVDHICGNELGQPVLFDSGKITIATSAGVSGDDAYPMVTWPITVTGVAGNVISYDQTEPEGAWANPYYGELILKRVSDGTTVGSITGQTVPTSGSPARQLTLASITGSVTAGDEHFAVPFWTITPGNVDWTKAGWAKTYSAKSDAPYRGLNKWSGQVLFLQAMGWIHSDNEYFREYVDLANQSNYPASGKDWASHHNSYDGSDFCADFWAAHWSTISAVSQTVG